MPAQQSPRTASCILLHAHIFRLDIYTIISLLIVAQYQGGPAASCCELICAPVKTCLALHAAIVDIPCLWIWPACIQPLLYPREPLSGPSSA